MGCCARVYHVAVIRTKAGSAVASAAPERIRRVANSVKLRLAAWAMRRTPQKNIYERLDRGLEERKRVLTLIARYLLRGNFCINRLVGRAQATQPTNQIGDLEETPL